MSACHAFASSTLVIQNHLLGDFPAKLQPTSFLCPFPCPSQYEATALLLRERSADCHCFPTLMLYKRGDLLEAYD